MTFNPVFAETMERLLAGKVICEFAYPACHALLRDPNELATVQGIMEAMGRKVTQTSDAMGYYAVYLDIEQPSIRRRLQSRFQKVATDWEGLCHWLHMSRQVEDDSYPIRAGQKLSTSELLVNIESSVSMQQSVAMIAQNFNVNTNKTPKAQLTGIINYLEKEGYLVARGTSGAIYQATAKWSLLMDQMEYVLRQEGILREDVKEEQNTVEEQGSLL